jgi:hypothetical protein
MRSKLTLFASVAAFAVSAFIMLGANPAGAWSTNQSASSACVDGIAVLNASFTNTEPASSSDNESDDDQSGDNQSGDDTSKDGKESEFKGKLGGNNDMIVEAMLGKLSLGTKTVKVGATSTWSYNSGKPDLTMVTAISNTVTFYLSWADGQTGMDYRSATFNNINCAPPVTTAPPTTTPVTTAPPTTTPVTTAPPTTTPVTTAPPTTTPVTTAPPTTTTTPHEVGHTGGSNGSGPSGRGLALAAFGLFMLLLTVAAPSRKTVPVKK